MSEKLSREALYELVWSKPMTAAAKELKISDVALAKQCHKANVPIPPRGWWAKKRAGKNVAVTPLPALPNPINAVVAQDSTPQTALKKRKSQPSNESPDKELYRVHFNHKFALEIELSFSEESRPTFDLLVEGIQDSLFEADNNHRLVPGMPLPSSGERLVGMIITLKGVSREECAVGREDREPIPRWEEGEDLRSKLLWHSIAIDREIENLRADQSDIWKGYEFLCPSIKPQNYRTQIKKIELSLSKFRIRCSNVAAEADTLIQKDKAGR